MTEAKRHAKHAGGPFSPGSRFCPYLVTGGVALNRVLCYPVINLREITGDLP